MKNKKLPDFLSNSNFPTENLKSLRKMSYAKWGFFKICNMVYQVHHQHTN